MSLGSLINKSSNKVVKLREKGGWVLVGSEFLSHRKCMPHIGQRCVHHIGFSSKAVSCNVVKFQTVRWKSV